MSSSADEHSVLALYRMKCSLAQFCTRLNEHRRGKEFSSITHAKAAKQPRVSAVRLVAAVVLCECCANAVMGALPSHTYTPFLMLTCLGRSLLECVKTLVQSGFP